MTPEQATELLRRKDREQRFRAMSHDALVILAIRKDDECIQLRAELREMNRDHQRDLRDAAAEARADAEERHRDRERYHY